MKDVEQLKALRDAAQTFADKSWCDDAIASLEAAEQPPDSIPLAQHEAALAQARREGLREALALVERDRIAAAAHSRDSRDAAWNALNLAAAAIRALAEKGGEVGK